MEYGLIGEHLSHSYSVDIHNKISNYNYSLVELCPNELEEFILKKDFKGINVTIPYKESVVKYLDYMDDSVKAIGACNTIVNVEGKLYGYNTDSYGLFKLIKKYHVHPKNMTVLILGSGGTSKTAYSVFTSLEVKQIYVASRTPDENTISYQEAYKLAKNIDIIVNTTPVGMYPNIDLAPIDISKFKNVQYVFDVVYNPINTELVLEARERNIFAVNGLYMLVAQAVRSYELFFGKTYNKDTTNTIERIYNEVLFEKQSIVLIGMPGSGKSTIGKLYAKKIGFPFIDTDKLIQSKYELSPQEIIATRGEKVFRKCEADVIAEISKNTSLIISTGGGAILNNQNIINLKKNGLIYFINRDLDNLAPSFDRPLSNTRFKLKRLYKKRINLYIKNANVIIDNNKTIADAINSLERKHQLEDFNS